MHLVRNRSNIEPFTLWFLKEEDDCLTRVTVERQPKNLDAYESAAHGRRLKFLGFQSTRRLPSTGPFSPSRWKSIEDSGVWLVVLTRYLAPALSVRLFTRVQQYRPSSAFQSRPRRILVEVQMLGQLGCPADRGCRSWGRFSTTKA
jgi:hypothetical protein